MAVRKVRITQGEIEAATSLTELLEAKGLRTRPTPGRIPVDLGEKPLRLVLDSPVEIWHNMEHQLVEIHQGDERDVTLAPIIDLRAL